MRIESGEPIMEGRYVGYTPGLMEWLTPVIVTWSRRAWHYHHSTQKYDGQIVYWIGPLPALKFAPLPLEFDL